MTNKEKKLCNNTIEKFNNNLLDTIFRYKEEDKKAKNILAKTIISFVDEIALLSHCAGMLYKKENYEVYINTIEELKKMLYEQLKEL